MNKEYQDRINTIFSQYGDQIGEAVSLLKVENSNFGVYTIYGQVQKIRYHQGMGISRISPNDLKTLESKLIEITGDKSIKITDSFLETLEPNRPIDISKTLDKVNV